MTRDELLELLARLRRVSVGGIRAAHKPPLLLWLFGRFAATGSTVAAYADAEEPMRSTDASLRAAGPTAEIFRPARAALRPVQKAWLRMPVSVGRGTQDV